MRNTYIPIRSSEIVRWGNVSAMIIETSAVNFVPASAVFSFALSAASAILCRSRAAIYMTAFAIDIAWGILPCYVMFAGILKVLPVAEELHATSLDSIVCLAFSWLALVLSHC